MKIAACSIFPEVFGAYMGMSIMGRAVEAGLVEFEAHDIRDFAYDRHRTVDDTPYGGGPGMVMKPGPVAECIERVLSDGVPSVVIMPSPGGEVLTQGLAEELSRESRRLVFLAGRYEGIDQRVVDELVDREISIGDYVLTGGELPVLVIIDVLVRLIPGVLGACDSLERESFSWGVLDYPHYTRPPQWRGREVPGVLRNGHHKEIETYRRKEALRLTLRKRPDLLGSAQLSRADRQMIESIKQEESDRDGLG